MKPKIIISYLSNHRTIQNSEKSSCLVSERDSEHGKFVGLFKYCTNTKIVTAFNVK